MGLGAIASIARGQSTESDHGRWALTAGEDPSWDPVVHSITLAAEETIRNEDDTDDVRPHLAFWCAAGNEAIGVRIYWRRFISSFNTEIGFKVDGDRILWQKWAIDRSNMVTSSRSDADSATFIDYIDSGSLLAVDIAPYAGSPIVVHFDLAGFPNALGALREACH